MGERAVTEVEAKPLTLGEQTAVAIRIASRLRGRRIVNGERRLRDSLELEVVLAEALKLGSGSAQLQMLGELARSGTKLRRELAWAWILSQERVERLLVDCGQLKELLGAEAPLARLDRNEGSPGDTEP